MKKIGFYPGSFDPFTMGHQSIVEKSLGIFDEIIIAVGYNINKAGYYSVDKRIEIIEKVFFDCPQVSVISYDGLTSDFCKRHDIKYLIRGLRNSRDFEIEKEIALINNQLNPNLETIFLLTSSDKSLISSSCIREILELGGNPMQFMPSELTLEELMCRNAKK